MKPVVIYTINQKYIIDTYNSIEDLETHVFDEYFVNLTNVLSGYGDDKQDIMACLCARALLSWNEEDRSAYLSSFEIPSRVYNQLLSPSEWPDLKEPEPEPEPVVEEGEPENNEE